MTLTVSFGSGMFGSATWTMPSVTSKTTLAWLQSRPSGFQEIITGMPASVHSLSCGIVQGLTSVARQP